ncbi:MAG: hypothetical protein FD129_2165, partial [bacterium]
MSRFATWSLDLRPAGRLMLALGLLVFGGPSAWAQGLDESQLPAGVREALGARSAGAPEVPLPGAELGDGPI